MALTLAQTKYGTVRGARGNNRGFTVFRGVPYGKSTAGALRFAPPQEPEPWSGVRDCIAFAPTCVQEQGSFSFYQKEFYPEPKTLSEDCLYLNVWTPAAEPGEKLPVFFWVHGGGYGGGYSYEQEFDGEAMCKRGCILVTIEYRCNSLGFFAHPELTARNGRSGNAGFYDQLLALNWVHENIEAFGGDPDNITVHGQSAGAMSTRTLLTSPLAKGLVRRVIIQSGGGINDWSGFRSMQEQEQLGVRLLQTAKMTLDEAMRLPAEEVYARLQKAMFALFGGFGGNLCFHPCLDGYGLAEAPGDAILAGRLNTQSIMVGSVSGDIGLQAKLPEDASDLPLRRRAVSFSSQTAWGEWNIQHDLPPIYGYYFDRNLPGDERGAWHSSELWYMFGSLSRCWRPWTGYDYELSDAMVDYWCAFARTGDPKVEGRPDWPPYTAATPEIMCFSDDGYGTKILVNEPYGREFLPYFQKSGMVGEIR